MGEVSPVSTVSRSFGDASDVECRGLRQSQVTTWDEEIELC